MEERFLKGCLKVSWCRFEIDKITMEIVIGVFGVLRMVFCEVGNTLKRIEMENYCKKDSLKLVI